jgi:hypothetical protein
MKVHAPAVGPSRFPEKRATKSGQVFFDTSLDVKAAVFSGIRAESHTSAIYLYHGRRDVQLFWGGISARKGCDQFGELCAQEKAPGVG